MGHSSRLLSVRVCTIYLVATRCCANCFARAWYSPSPVKAMSCERITNASGPPTAEPRLKRGVRHLMLTPSRKMPAAPVRKVSPIGWVFLVIICASFVPLLWRYPLITCSVVASISALSFVKLRRIKRIAQSRIGESICQFARSFDTRETDAKIIRAVYEELGRYLGSKNTALPLRATDQLFSSKGLNIDSEDLDEVAADIAFRAGRSLANVERNPYFGRIQTVADLVAFFSAQPESEQAQPGRMR